jgi:malonate decarboxylase delta subunit
MEQLTFTLPGQGGRRAHATALAGVVSSGNLEVLVEPEDLQGACRVDISTSAAGFGPIWQAVLQDAARRHDLANLHISINDAGATPAVVSLRLDQALAGLEEGA